MFLIVGLGNPGKNYERTRHNVGFMLADRLAEAYGIKMRPTGRAYAGEGTIESEPVTLLKPQTYMNLSGEAVSEFLERNHTPVESVIVAYDDCDLPFGRIRLRPGGGSGGHRGINSIITVLGSNEFRRVRLGIGRPTGDTADYVLSPFSPDEQHGLEEMLKTGVESVEDIISKGINHAMNRFNSR